MIGLNANKRGNRGMLIGGGKCVLGTLASQVCKR